MYGYDDGEGSGASLGRKLALGIGVLAIAAAGFFAFQAVTDDGGGGDAVAPAEGPVVGDTTEDSGSAGSTEPSVGDESDGPSTTRAGRTTTTTDRETSASETSAAETTGRAATTTAAGDRPGAASTTTTTPLPTTTVPATYPTRLDGTPEWVTVIYDVDSITLKGVVPDEAAKTRLQTLAEANARSAEQRATVNNLVTLNPLVPIDVGIRVVELTSTRFPPGSDDIVIEHAAELNRVVSAMQALPNTTALIIGHADQQGDEVVNYVLSRDRATAVQAYMVSQGIAPERLSSTAVGEEELLSLDDDEAALALNRRTEFVLFNLLLP